MGAAAGPPQVPGHACLGSRGMPVRHFRWDCMDQGRHLSEGRRQEPAGEAEPAVGGAAPRCPVRDWGRKWPPMPEKSQVIYAHYSDFLRAMPLFIRICLAFDPPPPGFASPGGIPERSRLPRISSKKWSALAGVIRDPSLSPPPVLGSVSLILILTLLNRGTIKNSVFAALSVHPVYVLKN